MIQVKNLSATYDKKSVFANLNFTLEDNSFTALCGKNGSGKSTLLSLMAGIIPAGLNYSGDILINGKNVFKMKRAEAAHNLSFLLQAENPVWNLTVRQFVETGLYSFGHLTKSQTDSAPFVPTASAAQFMGTVHEGIVERTEGYGHQRAVVG